MITKKCNSSSSGTKLRIHFTLDVDPDNTNTTDRTSITWHGVERIPDILDEFSQRAIRCTFFIRCDNQIRDIYGSYLGIYYKFQHLWESIREQGNEIAWHPHLYELIDGRYFPLRNTSVCNRILREAWEEIQSLAFSITSVRLGEAWHSTETMCELDRLGLAIDSTALPGRYRNDKLRSFDWQHTPNNPYHPSRTDYQVPGGKNALSILEVPMTTSAIKTNYDKQPLYRYLNPTYHNDLFKTAIKGHLQSLGSEGTFDTVLIFHPDEIIFRERNDLYSYDWDVFRKNIDILENTLAESGYQYEYCCLSDILT